MDEWKLKVKDAFRFIDFAPIVFVSSLTKQRVHTLFPIIDQVYQNINKRISTSLINDCIVDAMLLNEPKQYKGVQLKVFYSSQVSVNPPTFVFFVNDTECIHFSTYLK